MFRLTPSQTVEGTSKNKVRSLGHIKLCGILHVCWQTRVGVDSHYMITLLYREWLCLAVTGKNGQVYTVQACISVNDIKAEAADNGRGEFHATSENALAVFQSSC